MAAGYITRVFTVSTGVDLTVRLWVDDTDTPTVYIPIHVPHDIDGNPIDFATSGDLDAANASLADITTAVEALSALISASKLQVSDADTQAALATLGDYTNTLEALIAATNTAIGTSNTSLTTLAGYMDGLETLLGTSNSTLASLAGYTDGLEAAFTTLNAKDFATETTLAALASTDFATEQTLNNVEDRIGSTSSSAPASDAEPGVGLNGRLIRAIVHLSSILEATGAVDDAAYTDDTGAADTTLTSALKAIAAKAAGSVALPPGHATEDMSHPQVISLDQLGLDGAVLADGSATAINTAIFVADTKGYSYLSVLCVDPGSGCIIRYQGSDDNTNWVTIGHLTTLDGTTGWNSTAGLSTGNIMIVPVTTRYVRAILTLYGSGTVTLRPTLRTGPFNPPAALGVTPRINHRSTNPSASVNGATGIPIMDLIGVPIVRPHALPGLTWRYAAGASGIVSSTAGATIKAAAGSGVCNHINSIQLSAAAGTASEFVIRDGAGGTVLWRVSIPTGGMPLTTFYFEVPLRGTANTLLEVAMLTSSAGAVYFNAQGYEAP